jgi:hypothetical protein
MPVYEYTPRAQLIPRSCLASATQRLAVVKHEVEQHVSSKIVKARAATLKVVKGAETGWERAMDKIAERAGLTKGPDTRR